MRKDKNEDLDVPVEVRDADYHIGGDVYSHPSYGMISLSRQTANYDVPQFGSKVASSSIMNLKVYQAENTQSLGRNWYHATKTLIECEMTAVQYAELISSPNTEGVPCTIKYTPQDGRIIYKPHATEIEYIEEEIKDSLANLKSKLSHDKALAKELLTKKGTLKADEKKQLLSLIQRMDTTLQSEIPFLKKSIEESVDGMLCEAKSDVESMVTHVQTKLGQHLLENPDMLEQFLLEDKG